MSTNLRYTKYRVVKIRKLIKYVYSFQMTLIFDIIWFHFENEQSECP